jgi:hypothetical protein
MATYILSSLGEDENTFPVIINVIKQGCDIEL